MESRLCDAGDRRDLLRIGLAKRGGIVDACKVELLQGRLPDTRDRQEVLSSAFEHRLGDLRRHGAAEVVTDQFHMSMYGFRVNTGFD